MLLPPFRGAELKAFDRDGADITSELFAPSGFMRVDADYTAKPFEEWKREDWPSTYQSPKYENVCGRDRLRPAAPDVHARSKPNGTVIAPAPPRTGMPAGIMGRAVANTIADRIQRGAAAPVHTASMAQMGAACVASAGKGCAKERPPR